MENDFDISKTLEAKSDQLNAIDLIAGPRIIRITAVKQGSAEQPVIIHYEGDNGKPWKPCKSMRRVMAVAWGTKASNLVGKKAILVNDPEVVFGGKKEGGIRISHLSHINQRLSIMLRVSRAVSKLFHFEVLPDDSGEREVPVTNRGQERAPTHEELIEWLGEHATAALAFLTESGRLKEGQTLADLPEKNRAKIYRSQAFLDAAGITLTQSQTN